MSVDDGFGLPGLGRGLREAADADAANGRRDAFAGRKTQGRGSRPELLDLEILVRIDQTQQSGHLPEIVRTAGHQQRIGAWHPRRRRQIERREKFPCSLGGDVVQQEDSVVGPGGWDARIRGPQGTVAQHAEAKESREQDLVAPLIQEMPFRHRSLPRIKITLLHATSKTTESSTSRKPMTTSLDPAIRSSQATSGCSCAKIHGPPSRRTGLDTPNHIPIQTSLRRESSRFAHKKPPCQHCRTRRMFSVETRPRRRANRSDSTGDNAPVLSDNNVADGTRTHGERVVLAAVPWGKAEGVGQRYGGRSARTEKVIFGWCAEYSVFAARRWACRQWKAPQIHSILFPSPRLSRLPPDLRETT